MEGFGCFLGATHDSSGNCASTVASILTHEFNDVIRNAANSKVFYHTSTCHIERESDANSLTFDGLSPTCDYDIMHQPANSPHGTYFEHWVNA